MNLFSAIYHRFKKARWQIEYEVVSGAMILPMKRVSCIQRTHWFGKSNYITIRYGPQVSFERDAKTSMQKGARAIGGYTSRLMILQKKRETILLCNKFIFINFGFVA